MFVFRLWKRVHKPFIFFGLCVVFIIGFTNVKASVEPKPRKLELPIQQVNKIDTVESEFQLNMRDKDTLTKTILGNSNSQKETDNFLSELHSGENTNKKLRPLDTIPQLPHCNSDFGKKSNVVQEMDKLGSAELDDLGNDSSSDDLVPVPLGASKDLSYPGAGRGLTGRLVVVATLDGQVSLLDQSGRILWSICTGQMFSSTISSLQLNDDGKFINLIPSLTGGLYKYDGDSLQPMPLNADSLLKKSFKLSKDVVITGGKELRTFGVDVFSGSIRYECGMGDCYYGSKAKADSNAENLPVLVIKKQSHVVRAIDSTSGSERWNFSVGTHELVLAGLGDLGGDELEMNESESIKYSHILKVVIPDGLIMGANRENNVVWQQKFGSPISQAWVLENGKLMAIDTLKSSPLLEQEPALYVGMHQKQFYVQESQSTTERVEEIFGIDSPGSNLEQLKLEWKTSGAVVFDNENTALTAFTPPPNWATVAFKPFYVFERDEITTTPMPIIGGTLTPYHTDEESDGDFDDSDDNSSIYGPDFGEDDGTIQIIFVSLWYWWKEVLGISLLTAVLVNILLMRPVIRAVRSNTIREMLAMFRYFTNKAKEEEKALVVRRVSDTLELPCATTVNRQRSVSSSSNTSQLYTNEEVAFTSQYLKEFEPIQCLGKGAFGVVFEAKKKIDDRHYAVKRITLPNKEKSRIRVMREVKALAQLDHNNIVRYFNAWTENPPVGWLEKNDPLWNPKCSGSCSATMEYPSESFGPSADFTNAIVNRKKPDHSKISVPNTPSEDPNDSFIVFESRSQASSDYIPFEKVPNININSDMGKSDPLVRSSIIPMWEDNSVSSVSGKGFFRPTTLSISPSTNNVECKEPKLSSSLSNSSCGDGENIGDTKSEQDNSTVMYLYIQQELCQKRTLQDWLRAEKDRNLFKVVKLFAQIVEAVEYVHSKKLIHRDLKPSNIFLAGDSVNGEDASLTVKIGDFGLATTAITEFEAENRGSPSEEYNNFTVRKNLTGHVGTQLYMSPEQLRKEPYDYKVDIYSLGLIFLELLIPFSTDMEKYDMFTRVRRLEFPTEFSQNYQLECEQIEEMVSHDPSIRPDATKIKLWVKAHLVKLPEAPLSKLGDSQPTVNYSEPTSPSAITPGRSSNRTKYYKTQSCT